MTINISEGLFSESTPDFLQVPAGERIVSLFCGAGGLDIGFQEQGFEIEFAADHDQSAVTTYNNNHRGEKAKKIDLLTTHPKDIYKMATASLPEGSCITGIIGGPPCQGFSRGNAGRCHTDPRNQLALKYAEIVNIFHKKAKLSFFVFENVPEIKAKKNADFLTLLRTSLSKNFKLYEKEINASNFGVPQNRKRHFIVGINKKLNKKNYEIPSTNNCEAQTVGDAINMLPEPAFYDRHLAQKDIKFHPNHWTMKPKSEKFVTGEMPAGGRSFIKLDWTKPSRTVAYGNREIHVHPDGKRRLSIYEAMRLQAFPKEYILHGSLSDQVKQVSNAVPPPVAKAIAESLQKYFIS